MTNQVRSSRYSTTTQKLEAYFMKKGHLTEVASTYEACTFNFCTYWYLVPVVCRTVQQQKIIIVPYSISVQLKKRCKIRVIINSGNYEYSSLPTTFPKLQKLKTSSCYCPLHYSFFSYSSSNNVH
jgi:hypothetical protein